MLHNYSAPHKRDLMVNTLSHSFQSNLESEQIKESDRICTSAQQKLKGAVNVRQNSAVTGAVHGWMKSNLEKAKL